MRFIEVFLALGVHVTFLFSIFDIYFKSPLVKGVNPHQSQHDAVANRLVLFVIDGLRAESFVNHTTMPYLRSIAKEHGRSGISNTRVPTESRPGHVALIAGFYEDPSAITKGWKENPVDFDSVLNQTNFAWCWGAHDIIEIFTKSHVEDHVFANKFYPYDQTFSTDKNTTLLDAWVFDKVKDFFENAKQDVELMKKLHSDRIMFFLHLLGTDTSGHTHKPNNPNYLTTLRFVDEGIKQMVEIIENFYNYDNRTTFLMTSDHGMTDWGSHGSGDTHETETPYVIWGSGVLRGETLFTNSSIAINQADVTPLMSAILSIPVPVNSVGSLPLELLNMTLENKAKALYSNCKQLANQYNKKRNDVEKYALSLLYFPFRPLDKDNYAIAMSEMDNLLEQKEYEILIKLCHITMNLSLQGLEYYHKYYQFPLLIMVTLSFIGWTFYLLTNLILFKIKTNRNVSVKKRYMDKFVVNSKHIIALGIGLFFCALVAIQNLPIQYHIYCLMPALLWGKMTDYIHLWGNLYSMAKGDRLPRMILEIAFVLCGVICLSLSFTYRWMLSVPLLVMAIWPLFPNTRRQLSFACIMTWTVSAFILCLFTLLPVVGKEAHIDLVIRAGFLGIMMLLLYMWQLLARLYVRKKATHVDTAFNILQIMLMLIAMYNVHIQSKRFDEATPVSKFDQKVAWFIAVSSLIVPMFSKRRIMCRLAAVNMSILTFYILLSVSHEGLFLLMLITHVSCWAYIELRLKRYAQLQFADFEFSSEVIINRTYTDSEELLMGNDQIVLRQDFRRGFYFLVYIIVSFFGTGNIASLNSFEVRWVTCFVTSYEPFLITFLVLLKTLMPFLSVASAFQAVHIIVQAPASYLNKIVLVYSNIMGIILLYQVKNTGSWLEIGTSISQFVIIQLITLFIMFIQLIAKILTHVDLMVLFSKKPKNAFKDL